MPPLYSYACSCGAGKVEMRRMDEREQKPLPSCDRCKHAYPLDTHRYYIWA